MKTVAILVASLAAVLVFAESPTTHAAKRRGGGGGGDEGDPNRAVARAHGGHVWVRADALPTSDGSRLSAWLGGHAPKGDITAKTKEAPWSINYLAVFKKAAVPGAMTVQFVEKNDRATGFVDQYSPENGSASVVFRGSYDLSPDQGFNKGHTYVINVGQLLKGKFVLYAKGEVTLK